MFSEQIPQHQQSCHQYHTTPHQSVHHVTKTELSGPNHVTRVIRVVQAREGHLVATVARSVFVHCFPVRRLGTLARWEEGALKIQEKKT